MPRSWKWSLSLRSPHQNHVRTSPISHMCHISHAPLYKQENQKKLMQLQFAN
jgi:hypothetical protein